MSWVAVGVTAVGAIGSSVAANQQKQAAKGASAAATEAQGQTNALAQQQYEQTRADYAPFAESGYGAQNLLNRAAGIPAASTFDSAAYLAANPDVAADPWASQHPYEHYQGWGKNEGRQATYSGAQAGTPDQSAFTASPGYQFRLNEGQKAGNNAFAARGGAFSGNALKALAEYNQGMASNEYGNWWNQISDIANRGQAAVAGQANAGAQNVGTQANVNQNTAGMVGNALTAQGDARASGVLGVTNAIGQGVENYIGYGRKSPTTVASNPAYLNKNFLNLNYTSPRYF